MPRRKPGDPPKPLGRPKGKVRPRKTVMVRLEFEHVDWINANLPRTVTLSDFLNEALGEKIARVTART